MAGEETAPWREMYLLMRLAREWDLRFENLFRTGAVRKWYSSVGNEGLTVAAGSALERGDALSTLHRDVGAILAHYLDLPRLLPDLLPPRSGPDPRGDPAHYLHRLACQMMGKAEGFSEGYERSYHFGELDEERAILHVGMISHLGAMIPVAAGLAWGLRLRGTDRVALGFIGEGGTSTGDFHEALNMAGVMRLPLVLVIENNHYAFSTPSREQYACRSLVERAGGYGIAGEAVDGGDPEEVWRVVRRAAARARRGEGPTLIEADLVRLRGHSAGDDSMEVVPAEEMDRFRRDEPLARFEKSLQARGLLGPGEAAAIGKRLRDLLIQVTDRARAAADPRPAPRAIYATAVSPRAAPPGPSPPPRAGGRERANPREETENPTYLEAIARALREEMRSDSRVVLLGQDIAEFGGAFKVTRGFVEEFGRDRVLNTPIAESGTIGIACGAALLGRRPVVEMQFADFITCGFNQVVNVAAKMFYRWRAPVPLVIRCPCGGGAGAGPFHSQNPEAWFLHVPGLKVVAPAFPADALGLLKSAIRDLDPVLFLEHKQLYRRIREPLPAGELLVELGAARVVREGDQVSVIAYGAPVHHALAAAGKLAEEGISVEVIDLRTLAPLDEETVLASVKKTGKALVVHEAPLTGGFGAEIAARIAERGFQSLDGPVVRLGYPDTPVPYHPLLEAASLPDERRIAEAVRELARY
jgi:2-oxoisovalerate dehydrogenase E1 component